MWRYCACSRVAASDESAARGAARPAPPAPPSADGRLALILAARSTELWFETPGGRAILRVAVADTPESIARGFSFHRELPAEGMLYDLGRADVYGFTLRDSYVPLDLVFLGADGRVASVVEGAPLDPRPFAPPAPVRHVAELRGGTCQRLGVVAGTPFGFTPLPEPAAPPEEPAADHGAVVLVDADRSGATLASELQRRGVRLLHAHRRADSGAEARYAALGYRFARHIPHDDDPAALAAALADEGVTWVFPGSEGAVELADALAERLGAAGGNDPALRRARRDKHAMHEAAERAGLAVPRHALARSVEEALAFRAREGLDEVVVKPVASAGGDAVRVARTDAELAELVLALLGSRSRLGLDNDAVVLQERLVGEEYYVNTVTDRGRHTVTDLWRCHKRPLHGLPFQYDRFELEPGDGPLAETLAAAVFPILDALGVRAGAGHTEVMLTPERGVVLIESGARLDGLSLPELSRAAVGYGQAELLADLVTAPERFALKTSGPYVRRSRAATVAVAVLAAGEIVGVGGDAALADLPSFFAWRSSARVGQTAAPSTDAFDVLGYASLLHPDDATLRADLAAIRAREAAGALVAVAPPLIAAREPAGPLARRLAGRSDLGEAGAWARHLELLGFETFDVDGAVIYVRGERGAREAHLVRPSRINAAFLGRVARYLGLAEVALAPALATTLALPSGRAVELLPDDAAGARGWLAEARAAGLSRAAGAGEGATLCLDAGAVGSEAGDPPVLPLAAADLAALAGDDGALAALNALLASFGAAGFAVTRGDGALACVLWDRVAWVAAAAWPAGEGAATPLLRAACQGAREHGCDTLQLGPAADPRLGEEGAAWEDAALALGGERVLYPPSARFVAPAAPLVTVRRADVLGAPIAHGDLIDPAFAARVAAARHLKQSLEYGEALAHLGWECVRVGTALAHVTGAGAERRGTVPYAERLDVDALRALRRELGLGQLIVEPAPRVFFADDAAPLDFDPRDPEAFVRRLEASGFVATGTHVTPKKTWVVDLRPAMEAVLAHMAPAHRRDVATAARRGVVTELAPQHAIDDAAWGAIDAIHEAWAGRHEQAPDERRVVRAVLAHMPQLGFTVLARGADGALIGFLHALLYDGVGTSFAMMSSPAGASLKVSAAMIAAAMAHGRERGAFAWDFGGAWDERFPQERPSWRGFSDFKRRFGACPIYYPPTFMV